MPLLSFDVYRFALDQTEGQGHGSVSRQMADDRMTDVCPPIGPRPGALVRSIVDDAAPRRRSRDQQRLVAKLRQDGVSGDWEGEDGEGNPCIVEHGPDGLELYAAPEVEGDQTDPEIVGTAPPGTKSIDRLRRRMAPRQVNDRSQPPGRERDQLQAWQAYNDALWAPRS